MLVLVSYILLVVSYSKALFKSLAILTAVVADRAALTDGDNWYTVPVNRYRTGDWFTEEFTRETVAVLAAMSLVRNQLPLRVESAVQDTTWRQVTTGLKREQIHKILILRRGCSSIWSE